MFTSLEEAEFDRMATESAGFGSTPNLSARSYSRSRSRENSAEEKHEWSADAAPATDSALKPLKDLPKLDSFEEEKEDKEKVKEEEQEEEVDDFWGTSD